MITGYLGAGKTTVSGIDSEMENSIWKFVMIRVSVFEIVRHYCVG